MPSVVECLSLKVIFEQTHLTEKHDDITRLTLILNRIYHIDNRKYMNSIAHVIIFTCECISFKNQYFELKNY